MANQPTKYRKFVVGAASAALVASAVAPVASAATKDFSDIKGNTHEEAINALVEAGVITGYEDGTFKPNKTLTRSDVVKMMGKWLVSLGYEVPADYKTNPRFTDQTSKTNEELLKYSALVKDHGVFNGYENGSLGAAEDITRENMAIVLVRAFDAINETDLVAFVAEQEFDKDVTDRATAKAEARPYIDVLDYFDITNPAAPQFNPKATTTRGQFASFLYKTSTVEVEEPAEEVVTATKVESVSATNLKEVLVTFDGAVKAEEAEKITNYKLDGSTLTAISSAELQEDGKSVLINFSTDGPELTNQKVHKLTVSGISNIASQTYDFTALDVTVPEVASVEILGNKVLNVKFSEPVKEASATTRVNYKINGYVVNGEIDLSDDGKTATITLYSRLKAGENKITVTGVQDYANMTIINYLDQVFTVADDTEAPTGFTIEKATLDAATVKFSEAVDASTVKAANIYWTDNDGATKNYATGVVPTDSTFTTYRITFADTKLPARETTLVIEKASDLFGNTAAKLSSKVDATVDTTRPEITSLAVFTDQYGNHTSDSTSKLDIKFSKAISTAQFTGDNRENLVVKNSKGEIVAVANGAVAKANHVNTLTVTLSNALAEGATYTVEVKNVVDGTALNNKMIPQTFTITVPEVTAPTITNVAAVGNNGQETKIQVVYSNAMALEGEFSVLKSDRYMIQVAGAWYQLPAGTTFQPTYDSKAVIITVPARAKYDGVNELNASAITGVKTTLVADKNGNKLAGLTEEILSTGPSSGKWGGTQVTLDTAKVVAIAKNKVKLVYDRPLQYVNASDYRVGGATPVSASYETVDGKGEVTLTLATADQLNAAVSASVHTVAQGDIRSLDLLGNQVPAIASGSAVTIQDGVAPSLVKAPGNASAIYASGQDEITLTFDEQLSSTFAGNGDVLAGMFVIKEGLAQTATLIPGTDYTAAIGSGNDNIVITFTKQLSNVQKMTVATNDASMYIFDLNAYTLGGNSYAKANKVKFGTTEVTGVSTLNVAAAAQAALIAKINAGTADETEFANAGITGVTSANLNAVKATVVAAKATKGSDLIKSEIQTAVTDTVAVLGQIATLEGASQTITLAGDAGQTNLDTDIAKPAVGAGFTATWTGANPGTHITVANGDAAQGSRPANGTADATETLTLTVTKGDASVTTTYTVTVEQATS